jgi:hypothetical protein
VQAKKKRFWEIFSKAITQISDENTLELDASRVMDGADVLSNG